MEDDHKGYQHRRGTWDRKNKLPVGNGQDERVQCWSAGWSSLADSRAIQQLLNGRLCPCHIVRSAHSLSFLPLSLLPSSLLQTL